MPALRIPGKLNLDYCFCYPPLPPTRCVWGGCRRNQWLTFPLGCYRGRFSLLGRLQLPGAAPELHPITHSQPPGHSPLGLTGQLTPGQGGSLPQRLGLPCHPRGKLSTRYAVVYTGVSGPSRGPGLLVWRDFLLLEFGLSATMVGAAPQLCTQLPLYNVEN